jgi:hypothetical protein
MRTSGTVLGPTTPRAGSLRTGQVLSSRPLGHLDGPLGDRQAREQIIERGARALGSRRAQREPQGRPVDGRPKKVRAVGRERAPEPLRLGGARVRPLEDDRQRRFFDARLGGDVDPPGGGEPGPRSSAPVTMGAVVSRRASSPPARSLR